MDQIDVGCAIIHRQGELLIAQRHLEDSFGGFWEFPGGKREVGETIEECLTREVHEELGVQVQPQKLLCQRDHESSGRKISLFFYFCVWVEGEAMTQDCKDFRWVSWEGIEKFKFIPGDQEIVKDLRAHWREYF